MQFRMHTIMMNQATLQPTTVLSLTRHQGNSTSMMHLRIVRAALGISIAWFCINTLRKTLGAFDQNTEHSPSRFDGPTASGERALDRKNKTLVIIIGNLRGGELAWETLYRNVLDRNSADLALLIGETAPKHKNATLFDRATYTWTFPEYDDWADAVDLIDGTSWRYSLIPLLHKWSTILGGVKEHKFAGSGGVIFMIRWFLSRKLQDLDLINRYERFVVTRSDHFYMCSHDLSQMDARYLYVPKGEDCGGITDRHLVVGAANVLSALNILPPVIRQPEKYADLLKKRSGNPEKVLHRRWREANLIVRRFDRMMFTCGEPGDMTRWRTLSETKVSEGVQLKYPKEYNSSKTTCALESSMDKI